MISSLKSSLMGDLPDSLTIDLCKVSKYPEGKSERLDIKSKENLEELKQLIDIKAKV